jgi:hypothetical protein
MKVIENDWLQAHGSAVETCMSGKNQLFRLQIKGDRTFISEDNANLILEIPANEFRATLHDGIWYWKNVCPTCCGEKIHHWWLPVCHKHDICVECKIHYDQVKTRNYNKAGGWICTECKEKQRSAVRVAALKEAKRKELDESDCQDTSKVTCPFCFHEMEHEMDSSSQNGFQEECSRCGGEFDVEVEFAVSFTSSGLHPPEGYDEIMGVDDEEEE